MPRDARKALTEYRAKRDFGRTREPRGGGRRSAAGGAFVVQKHAARRLHYDFRLELDGVLKSWAVPKGPSTDPREKRLAVEVEDHPLEYAHFEGRIPAGEYGGGTVMVWDRGTWEPEGDPREAYRKGRLRFRLSGAKLRGRWSLARMSGDEADQWLLIKGDDEFADPGDILAKDRSALSGKSLDEIGDAAETGGSATSGRRREARRHRAPRDTTLPGARAGRPPADFRPQLATLYAEVPPTEDWLHEIKYDGYRLLAVETGGRWRLWSRNGNDWTARLPSLAAACASLGLKDSVLDGELVSFDARGASDFQALQNRLRNGDAGLVFLAFDLPFHAGQDLRRTPLRLRKQRLAELLRDTDAGGVIRYSDHIEGRGEAFFAEACKGGLEGIVAKQADARYESRRTHSWRKIKCGQRQELVIGGYTDPGGARPGFGALLLGYFDRGELKYAGRVGTGFDERTLRDLGGRLRKLETPRPAFVDPPSESGIHWCRPELVAEIAFAEWTRDGRLRHPSFQGLREDKPATGVLRERPSNTIAAASASAGKARQTRRRGGAVAGDATSVAGVRLSNPDRVLYPDQGVTKAELAEYYAQVADWILPHIAERPLSLVRCPRGRQRHCFFQKHLTEALPEAVHGVKISEKDGESTYIAIDDLEGLITLVQFGTLELHPWPARADRLDRPDFMVFDLDPGPDVPWTNVTAAAAELHDLMDELGLVSFLRTTGGKGLHVVVPIARRHGWDEMRGFAEAVARHLAERDPARFVANSRKAKRAGRIFIDYLRNGRGATAIANYSTRARSGAPVAVPLRWDELSALPAADLYNIRNLPRRLGALRKDPWEGFLGHRQRLPKL